MTANEITRKIQKFLLRKLDPTKMSLIDDVELLELYNTVARDYALRSDMLQSVYSKKVTGVNIHLEPVVTDVQSFIFVGNSDQQWTIVDDYIIVLRQHAVDIPVQIEYSRLPSPLLDMDDEIDLPAKYLSNFIELTKLRLLYDLADGSIADYENLLERYVSESIMLNDKHGLSGGVRRYWLGLPGDDSYYEIVDNRVGTDTVVRDGNTGEWVFT